MFTPPVSVIVLVLSLLDGIPAIILLHREVQVHQARLHHRLWVPCAARNSTHVTRASWTDEADEGPGRLRRLALVSNKTGNIIIPRVTPDLTGLYECTGTVRLPRREVIIKVRHRITVVCSPGSFSPGGEYRTCIPCDYGSYASKHGSLFCLWCPPGKTTFKQGSSSLDDCQRTVNPETLL
ncbi:hypothetical protein HPB48_022872 [Haemaphysalis longicornis]|uniref:Ig-like domain-containing protein n=1 Tax=Haemaphysalis longicornis TaxID=44386 RepID=A0A9J6GZL1_HAELO|nr:hypothetical protein HPB48_022872 [Haemaphysalis longicornis]